MSALGTNIPWAFGFAALLLRASPATAQDRPRRHYASLSVTVCPDDAPATEWRLRVHHELLDDGIVVVDPPPFIPADPPDLRITIAQRRCDGSGETYEIFMSRRDGASAESALLSMEGVDRDDRPALAGLRAAAMVRAHRRALVVDAPRPALPATPEAPPPTGFYSLEFGADLTATSTLWPVGGHLGLAIRPSMESIFRARLEVGMNVGVYRKGIGAGLWVSPAAGVSVDVWRRERAQIAIGIRAEYAQISAPLALVFFEGAPRVVPTVRVGLTAEAHFGVTSGLWVFSRLELGGYALGARFQRPSSEVDLYAGLTAGLSLGLRWDLGPTPAPRRQEP